jgi:hypothetical protein
MHPHQPQQKSRRSYATSRSATSKARVTTNPAQLTEASVTSGYRPGEGHSCITLNCIGGAVMENISLENVHLTFGGGGTAEDAARRDLPQIAGE